MLMPSAPLAFVMLALAFPMLTMHGVGTVALQLITPNEYRARVTALYFFVVNLTGLGFGPMLMALLTDHFFHDDRSEEQTSELQSLMRSTSAVLCLKKKKISI